ncbi:L-glutamine:2-deoxy-scyllo-inosose aminotransferase [Paenibacillus agaridevorans]|uniref:L-glutamine:2-deoxy-scyllo-inosose aminotransferase n=1 Tax=Paenibacillus agaridevorans TaxID=171404 RepID=A0A2R5EQK1_9BACL|nr:DegT/DnrJ/EryC1/StrS family aminotransferase [Paenibacillus agaridevorans]GBG08962.1 L-glutamine:2-deoxy-scyllo-inosose aminotransferase [Paenibacillus agaridevorans]
MNKLAILGGKPVGKFEMPSFPYYDESDVDAVADTMRSGVWGLGGAKQKELEEKFAAFCGVPYSVSASNGTVTLRMAMEALEIGPGDEVIVPGLTWQATAATVLDVNAVPILVDVDPETYTIDPKAIEAAITERTKCIIPVHLYGRMANMDELLAIADKHNLYIIEDCAHQQGARWDGKAAGSLGTIGSFSLQSSKILNSGEGGLLTTKDSRLSDLLHSLRFCGRAVREGAEAMQSGNFRLSELQAALAIVQLSRLEEQNAHREINATYIENQVSDIEGIKPMYRHPKITRQAFYNLTLRYDASAWEGVPKLKFLEALKAELDNESFHYGTTYEPLHMSPLYRPHSKKTHRLSETYWQQIDPRRFDLPVCKKAYEEESLNFMHMMLMTNREGCDIFVEAIKKLRANVGELAEFARK